MIMCSVGVVQSVAHSLKSDNHANDPDNHANDSGDHADVSCDCADGSSGSSVESNDNCPGKDAESASQVHVAVGDTSSVADSGATAVAVGDTDATGVSVRIKMSS